MSCNDFTIEYWFDPRSVFLPHFVVGNFVTAPPFWQHLLALFGLTLPGFGDINVAFSFQILRGLRGSDHLQPFLRAEPSHRKNSICPSQNRAFSSPSKPHRRAYGLCPTLCS